MKSYVVIPVGVPLAALLPSAFAMPGSSRIRRPTDPARIFGLSEPTLLSASQSQPTSSANPHFFHLSVADGLSQSDARAIVQSRQGCLWFGIWLGGLNRYDGCTFKVRQ